MADGSTLIASSGYPTLRSVVLHAVTTRCVPNRAFGKEGVATITLTLRPRPGNPPADGVPPNGLWVNAETKASIAESFHEIARALNLQISNEQDAQLSVLTWLNSEGSGPFPAENPR